MAIFTGLAAGAVAGATTTAAVTTAAAGATAGLSAATVGSIAAGVGAVGSAVTQMKASKVQQDVARAANARERRKQLAALRKAQRLNEFMGAATNTTGASSQVGQRAAMASSTAANIGEGFTAISAARQMSKWNNMSTGFGVLTSVGSTMLQMPSKVTNPGTFNQKDTSLFS